MTYPNLSSFRDFRSQLSIYAGFYQVLKYSPLNRSKSQQKGTQTLGAARYKASARFIHVKTKRYMPYHRNVRYNPSNIQLQKKKN